MIRALRLGVLGLLVPALASAEVFDNYGFGSRSASMGGAMTAEANDFSATFYNPALLVHRQEANFGASVNWYRAVTDVKSTQMGRTLDCTTCSPPDTVGFSLGLVGPLGGKVKNRIALGVGIYLPFQRLVQVQMPEPNAPHWFFYQSHNERMSLFLGAGGRLTDWLTIGAGLQILANLVGQGAGGKVDVFSKQVEARTIEAQLATRAAPVFAIHLQPVPRLRFGVTYRWEMALDVQIPATVDLDGIGTLGFLVGGTTHYTPHQVQFGASMDITQDFTVSIDGQWMHWQSTPSPYDDISIDLSGDVLEGLGLGSALDVTSPRQPPGFQDTLNARVGFEYRVGKRFAARAGGFYRPTPVPRQDTPGTNILDGNTIALTYGLGVNFDDPLEVFAAPINVDLSGLFGAVLPREANKEATDTVPSYSYQAKLYGVTATIRYDF